MLDRRTRLTVLVVSFLLVMALLLIRQVHVDHQLLSPWVNDHRIAETIYVPPNESLQVMVMGFHPFVSDMLFMEANNYFATHLSLDRQYRWLDSYLASIVGYCRDRQGLQQFHSPEECSEESGETWVDGLFPFNPRVYLWASQVVKYGGFLTNEVVDKAVYYGRTGIHFCPDSWELYSDVGFNLFFEYRDLDDETLENLKRQAMDYFTLAATLPNSKENTAFALSLLWNREDAATALRNVYMTYYHSNTEQRRLLRGRLETQGYADLAHRLEKEEERRDRDFPYYPLELMNLLGSSEELLTKSPLKVDP